MIEVKAPISGWHEVNREMAFEFAVSRYNGMTCKDKYEKVCELIRGVIFTEKELIDECCNRRRQRNSQSVE